MAEEKAAGAPALDTNIETGGFDEKRGQAPPPTHAPKAPVAEDEEPDEDMDALIEDLESEDGHAFDEEEETQPGGGRVVPEDQLQTDSRVGLTEAEVINRRRKWGLNQMKEERENMILKFLMFFVGPIQFVMVSQPHPNISSFPCPPLFLPRFSAMIGAFVPCCVPNCIVLVYLHTLNQLPAKSDARSTFYVASAGT